VLLDHCFECTFYLCHVNISIEIQGLGAFSDLDSDLANRFGSFLIQIHNTVCKSLKTKFSQIVISFHIQYVQQFSLLFWRSYDPDPISRTCGSGTLILGGQEEH